MTEAAAFSELDDLARSLLPGTGRIAGAIEFARAAAGRVKFLLPLFGGVDGLTAKAQALYDEYAAPYDIPGLKDDTEAAVDVAAKLIVRDLIHNAAAAI